ncbi:MAG: hypothetical protein MRY64_03055 [Hyphomonadaceae bacterium]|nr:hypothetical protein [Hyphomonadaceae bacterium]
MAGDGTAYDTGVEAWHGQETCRIAYFGHDVADAAVRRRVRALQEDGLEVTGFMPRRRKDAETFWDNVDLGETSDGAFAKRLGTVFSGAARAAAAPAFAEADLILARNMDMLACAFEAKRRAGLATPVIYECLDVHRLLTREDPAGMAMRAIERALVSRCARVWVSSPGFLENHFERRHAGHYTADLVENRLPAASDFGPRPDIEAARAPGPLRLGWVGNLRCARSFALLLALADRFGDAIQIHLHGQPARREIPVFEPEIDRRENVTFHGRYAAPDDLAGIYGGLDAVWAGDFMEAGANSVWLLPNRIYEGGYFAVPPLAPAGTQTAAWIEARATGLTLAEPLEDVLPAQVAALIEDPTPLAAARANLLALDTSVFVEPRGEMVRLTRLALGKGEGT